ncbi:hypothetical protein C2E20_8779 [Micractinium conductrix]|uniref:Ergosterol biosynthetic protein 28 n=1 Tax=Micractinium conductrix TaxID=554055 RepID=A0A2P6V0F0_9CHLO|nr:hypothetical protein C2E20_8779 [Micractinium conductrix]|eukprot:PSC67555.1 hypothetical protein C2E20_8779 [Micractinium conductrix]
MPSVTALRRWLVFVALLRLFSVVLGYAEPQRFQTNLYNKQPDGVTDLAGRIFATWTLTSCILCLICARNPCVPAIYGATLASFLVALLHFLMELTLFQTMSLKFALQPMAVATISSLWMALGWNYYTAYAERAEPTMSEDITVTQKDD